MNNKNPTPQGIPPYQQSAQIVLADLCTDAEFGLSNAEVQARLKTYGKNILVEQKPVPGWRKFLVQFKDTLVVLLLIATVISAVLWVYQPDANLPYEAIAIFAIVLLNALLGYVQQERAERAVAALRQMAAAQARVIRDGEQQSIPASELVPGDIILIEEGDTIPADARVIQSTALRTAEAALTGESLPVAKHTAPIEDEVVLGDRHNMIFSGTAASYGRGRAVVTATGMNTEMGNIAGLLKKAPQENTPLQKELDRVGRLLGIAVIVIAVVMVATILLVEEVNGLAALMNVLIFGVALAVAAVPEGLPAVVTAVLSLGVQRMAKKNAIVRKLAAVETLGSADVIASDKTGTLTRNEMTVRRVVTASGQVDVSGTGYAPAGELRRSDTGGAIEGALQLELERALIAAERANNAVLQQNEERWIIHGDPTEGALIVAARKAGLDAETMAARYPRIAEIPFSSERKRMSTIHTDSDQPDHLLLFSKGAPDVLLALCSHEQVGHQARPLDAKRRAEIQASNEALAGDALRTLAVATRLLPRDALTNQQADESVEQELVFLGLFGMLDPPRDEVRDAVTLSRDAGIRPIMITGDHPVTARVIAAELGIEAEHGAVTGAELEAMSSAELRKTAREVSVFARVNPEHKLRLVKALQQEGMIVAMTGDGVNDAPALKSADIGVAMGITGTDVSKEAADMILTDDNFASIVAAVEEGRSIFANIRKFLRYLLSSNMGEVLTMFFGVILADLIGLVPEGGGVVLPLLATQILWINLLTDGAPALALGVDPASRDIMRKPPRPPSEGVITASMWRGVLFVGVIMAAGTLLVLDASLPGGFIEGGGSLAYGQTMAFTTLVLFQLFNAFNARSDDVSAFGTLFSNVWLWAAIAFALLLQIAVVYLPFLQQAFSTVSLSASDWLYCALVASSVLWLRELSKLLKRVIRPA